jgi:hypothetical protein
MANTLLTSSIIMKEALMILENDLTFTKNVNREYDDKFGIAGAKIGATINARKPPRYIGRTGQALQVEGSTESYVPITLDTQFGVDISFSSTDLTLHIDEFSNRFLKPAMATIANKIDYDGMGLYKDVFRYVNANATAGTLTGGSVTAAQAQAQVLAAGAILTESGVPKDGQRALVMSPNSTASAITPLLAQFNNAQKISAMFGDATVATRTLGFDWAEDANVQTHTALASGTATNNSAVPAQGALSWAIVCTGTATLKKGDVFSVTGVYAINPQSRQSTGRLMQFVVTADTVLSAATVTIPSYPAYITSGQFATCTGTASTGAGTVTWYTGAVGSAGYDQNLAYHRDAFTLATADLLLPGGVDMAERASHKGLSMRMVRQYDINSDMLPVRFDVLYGWKTIYPELAVRVGG